MGVTGPVPKRAEERRRRNKVDITQVEVFGSVEVPPAPKGWHKIAADWYASLATSGQSRFYEPSDWATAYLVAESISRDMKPQVVGINQDTGEPVFATVPLKGSSMTAYLSAMAVLLTTEGHRRRAQLEIMRRPERTETPADVVNLDDYRDL